MPYFEYNQTVKNVEYYEILENLMERWEYEIVEFKEAKSNYDADKIGRYFSAISNEANLRQQQYGWLVFGVGEEQGTKVKKIVGTAYKRGNNSLLERFKYEISRDTTNGMTFYDIIEIFPVVNGKERRVLMFKIPAAATGIPTDWKTNYYERAGESLVPLKQYKYRCDTFTGTQRLVKAGSGTGRSTAFRQRCNCFSKREIQRKNESAAHF